MKRILVKVVVALLLISTTCTFGFAEGFDFSQMSVDELVEIKTSLEAELRSRPEALPFVLSSGVYVVGVDIKPGRYFVATATVEKRSTDLNVFPTKEIYDQRWTIGGNGGAKILCNLTIGEEAEHIELTEGNYVDINAPVKFSLVEFEKDDYCEYTPPEGTNVPAGIYIVGEDIPAGTYRVFPASVNWGFILIYGNASDDNQCLDSQAINLDDGSYITIRVADGNMIELEVDVVMNKQPALTFD